MLDHNLLLERTFSARNVIITNFIAFAIWCAWVLWLASPASAQGFPYDQWRHNSGLEYNLRATHYGHGRYRFSDHGYDRRVVDRERDGRDRGDRYESRERVKLYREMNGQEYEFDENKHGPGWSCTAAVRGLGTQYIGLDGATQTAWKDWMERVRYDLGEKYLDATHAENIEKRCGRTSIGETLGQVLYRCEIVANPCKAEYTDVNTPERAGEATHDTNTPGK